jgi:hypothetical protein
MSDAQIKKLARTFIEEQKRILEEYGDGVVRSKCKDAVEGAQKTFRMISTASHAQVRANDLRVKD